MLTSSKLTILFGHGIDERSMLVFADCGRSKSSSESEQILNGIIANNFLFVHRLFNFQLHRENF